MHNAVLDLAVLIRLARQHRRQWQLIANEFREKAGGGGGGDVAEVNSEKGKEKVPLGTLMKDAPPDVRREYAEKSAPLLLPRLSCSLAAASIVSLISYLFSGFPYGARRKCLSKKIRKAAAYLNKVGWKSRPRKDAPQERYLQKGAWLKNTFWRMEDLKLEEVIEHMRDKNPPQPPGEPQSVPEPYELERFLPGPFPGTLLLLLLLLLLLYSPRSSTISTSLSSPDATRNFQSTPRHWSRAPPRLLSAMPRGRASGTRSGIVDRSRGGGRRRRGEERRAELTADRAGAAAGTAARSHQGTARAPAAPEARG